MTVELTFGDRPPLKVSYLIIKRVQSRVFSPVRIIQSRRPGAAFVSELCHLDKLGSWVFMAFRLRNIVNIEAAVVAIEQ
jgi:hypothetical protein